MVWWWEIQKLWPFSSVPNLKLLQTCGVFMVMPHSIAVWSLTSTALWCLLLIAWREQSSFGRPMSRPHFKRSNSHNTNSCPSWFLPSHLSFIMMLQKLVLVWSSANLVALSPASMRNFLGLNSVSAYTMLISTQYFKPWSTNAIIKFQREFFLFTDHYALKYLSSQDKISARHTFWKSYLQQFTFVIKRKTGTLNRVADALSRRHSLLSKMRITVPDFDSFLDLYAMDPFFGTFLLQIQHGERTNFVLQDGFLLCGP